MTRGSFGELFKSLRIRSAQTLRSFCASHGFDPGNMSKLERGRLPPPTSDAKLKEYATALGLQVGTDDWFEFHDRAAAETGRVPKDILSDEDVVAKLPALFRTIRGNNNSFDELRELVERIRRA